MTNGNGTTRTSEVTERERWTSVAFAACAIAGMTAEQELPFLRTLHDKWFADVPAEGPLGGGANDAARATKMLLWTLIQNRTDPERMRKLANGMTPHVRQVLGFT